MLGETISVADVDRVFSTDFRGLRFPSEIEARFEHHTGKHRSRYLAVSSIICTVLFDLSLIGDYEFISDVYNDALILRLGIVTPLSIAMFAILWRNPRAWLRETMGAAMSVIIVASLLYLTVKSRSPLAAHAHYPLMLMMVFPNVIQRIYFWYAVSATLIATLLCALAIPHIYGLPPSVALSAVTTLSVTNALTLFANWTLGHDQRRGYLIALREELRAQQLMNVNEKLSQISTLDPLTGLANRRRLEQYVNALWTSPRMAQRPIAVLMIDIDHFKKFNDHYGHQAGDFCLKVVAEVIQDQMRSGTDLAVRLGGEEFLVVLPDVGLDDALGIADRLRNALAERGIAHSTSPTAGVVTTSIGVTVVTPATTHDFSDAIAAADEALYSAKEGGRNRIWPLWHDNAAYEKMSA